MPLRTNAVISTTRAGAGKLVWQPAMLGVPSARDMDPQGGLVSYILLLDPGSDILPGDILTIQSWGRHTIDTSRRYRVTSADPSGGLGLEAMRCRLAEWTGR